jgi:8-oxo-dGTP pyrophosphatase MutT (NUDIX family)
MRAVGCFLEYEGKFVILLRGAHKPEGNTWGLPTGKVEKGESDDAAMLRELFEETGYRAKPRDLQLLGEFIFKTAAGDDFEYVAYRVLLPGPHDVKLEDDSHTAHLWVTGDECYARSDLITDFHKLLELTRYVTPAAR